MSREGAGSEPPAPVADPDRYRADQARNQTHARPGSDRERPPLERRPGAGSLSRAAMRRDGAVRQWGVVTPAATTIGRATSPDDDVSERIRRLHDEQHAATAGYSARAHQLDRLRTTQALCNALDLTPWQRDLTLGVMGEIDLTAFGSQRAIPTVALVVIRHVVDCDRRAYFGLDDIDLSVLSTERMDELFDEYKRHDITDESAFKRLTTQHGLDKTSLNRLRRVLKDQLEEDLSAYVYGRNPARDPNLPLPSDSRSGVSV